MICGHWAAVGAGPWRLDSKAKDWLALRALGGESAPTKAWDGVRGSWASSLDEPAYTRCVGRQAESRAGGCIR